MSDATWCRRFSQKVQRSTWRPRPVEEVMVTSRGPSRILAGRSLSGRVDVGLLVEDRVDQAEIEGFLGGHEVVPLAGLADLRDVLARVAAEDLLQETLHLEDLLDVDLPVDRRPLP